MYMLDALVRSVVTGLTIIMTIRAGRGYGFGILSLLLLICTTLDLLLYPPPQPTNLGGAILAAIFRSGASQSDQMATAYLLIGAAIVAGVDGQWLWLVGLIVAGLLPGVISDPAAQQQRIMDVLLIPGGTALLAVPQAAVLAYSIARIIHPPTSASTRKPTPSASR